MSSFLDMPEGGVLPACAILTDDPMRVEMFAAHYLEQAKLYTRQRGMTGYTGSYAGIPVVIQAVGYGGASMTAHLHEMVSLYGVRTVIYAGECVSRESSVLLRELVIGAKAYTGAAVLEADEELLKKTTLAAKQCALSVRISMIHTDDRYRINELESCCTQACIVDYATYDLYEYAQKHGIEALSILAVSERFRECLTPSERQSQLHGLTRLVFETVALIK